jgi:hypothetical protein
MKKSIIISIALIFLLGACQKAEEMKYIGETNAVFGTTSDTLTPIVYSFLEHPEALGIDTILVPVRIQGNRTNYDRTVKISIVTSKTTAIATTHYVPLKDQYIMPADSGEIEIPIIVNSSDNSLSVTPVVLALQIEPNEYFGSNPGMQYTTVTFSNTIKEPTWWSYWYDSQSSVPKFSATSYSLLTMVTGRTSFSTSTAGNSSDWYISIYSMLYVWTPFYNAMASGVAELNTWIGNHPGWVLAKHTSDEYYDFYNESYLSKKFTYGAVSSGSTVYGIFDENGKVLSR